MSRRTLVVLQAYDPALPGVRTFYLTSGTGFTTTPSETPASQAFDPTLSQGLAISRKVQGVRDSAARPAYGEVVVVNVDGSYDAWAGYAFDGRAVEVREGPETGAYPADFPVIWSGTMDRVDIQRDTVTIRVRDRVAELDRPLTTETFLGDNIAPDGLEGEAGLENVVKPLVFGQVKEIPLTPVNPQRLIYHVSDNAATVSQVRDSAIALGLTGLASVATPAATLNGVTAGLVSGARRGAVAYSPLYATYVIGGQGAASTNHAIYTSADFASWSGVSSAFTRTAGGEYVAHLRWFDVLNQFVAVGGNTATGAGLCATSPTGGTWTTRTLGGGFSTATASCVGYGNGVLVVGSDTAGVLRYSTDGGATFNATTASSLPATINDIWFADGMFVLVGSGGGIQTSPDGITWTAQTSGTSTNLTSVRYVSNRWVVAGNSGVIVTSVDTKSWVPRLDGTAAGKDDIADDDYSVFAVGGTSLPTISSTRGAEWSTMGTLGFFARSLIYDGVTIRMFGVDGGGVARVASRGTPETFATLADLEDDALAPAAGGWGYYSGASGTYVRLGSPPFGPITADAAQGATVANRTAGQLFAAVLTRAGFTAGDWSASDITALDTADGSAVHGYYVTGNETVNEVLDSLASSCGAWWGVDKSNVFRVKQFTAPSGSPTFTITDADIVRGSFERLASSDPLLGLPSYRTTLKWPLSSTLDPDGVVVSETLSVQTTHLLAQATDETVLYADGSAAATEAARRQTLRGTMRSAYRVTLRLEDYAGVELGDVGTLTYARFGLSGGVSVRVLGVEPDATARRVTLTLWA